MENITITQLKTKIFKNWPINYKIVGDDKIIIQGRDNTKYVLNNVKITRTHSHIKIMDRVDFVILPSRVEKLLSYGILLLSVAVILFIVLIIIFKNFRISVIAGIPSGIISTLAVELIINAYKEYVKNQKLTE